SASISPAETVTSNAGSLQAGSCRTQSGLSHSWDRPTSISPAPRAQTISVALAKRETMRLLGCMPHRLPNLAQGRITAKDRHRIKCIAQQLVGVKGYCRQITC